MQDSLAVCIVLSSDTSVAKERVTIVAKLLKRHLLSSLLSARLIIVCLSHLQLRTHGWIEIRILHVLLFC